MFHPLAVRHAGSNAAKNWDLGSNVRAQVRCLVGEARFLVTGAISSSPPVGDRGDGCRGVPFRMIGIGAHDLVKVGRAPQAGLFDAGPGDRDLDDVLDALRDRFDDDAVVRGRGFGVKLARQGPSKVE